MEFTVRQTEGKARTGLLATAHGQVATPLFMPCGTCGTVKGVTPDQLRDCGVQMVLANAYHLMLRPGAEVVAAAGGLGRFMAWDGPILTDSGGYQVFSLAAMREVSDDGVVFRSHVDGATVELTPEKCIQVQADLGADIIMQLDECPPADAPASAVAEAVRRSALWARRCKEAWAGSDQALFAIQQGGVHADLRAESAARIVELDLPGYAIGGLSVGEDRRLMTAVLDEIDQQLPRDRPRYLMGVGEPRDILAAVAAGVDMFDCVLPTRNGRNGQAFTWAGRLKLRNAAFARDHGPLEQDCRCYACRNFSRAAIRHYFLAEEMLGPTLVTIHNLTFFAGFLAEVRAAIAAGQLAGRSSDWMEKMYRQQQDTPG